MYLLEFKMKLDDYDFQRGVDLWTSEIEPPVRSDTDKYNRQQLAASNLLTTVLRLLRAHGMSDVEITRLSALPPTIDRVPDLGAAVISLARYSTIHDLDLMAAANISLSERWDSLEKSRKVKA